MSYLSTPSIVIAFVIFTLLLLPAGFAENRVASKLYLGSVDSRTISLVLCANRGKEIPVASSGSDTIRPWVIITPVTRYVTKITFGDNRVHDSGLRSIDTSWGIFHNF